VFERSAFAEANAVCQFYDQRAVRRLVTRPCWTDPYGWCPTSVAA